LVGYCLRFGHLPMEHCGLGHRAIARFITGPTVFDNLRPHKKTSEMVQNVTSLDSVKGRKLWGSVNWTTS